MCEQAPDGTIQITEKEKADIIHAKKVMNSNCNDVGDLIVRISRMSGFVPVNVPIICGMFLAPPTMAYTAFFQALNQTYNAGLNFANKPSGCQFTNRNLLEGYTAAMTSSITISLGVRKLSAPWTKGATGKKLLFLNFLVGASGSMTANFFNCLCMRYPEIDRGLTVYSDNNLTQPVGVSKICASSAVYETASSRVVMSFLCLVFPILIVFSVPNRFQPQKGAGKFIFDALSISGGLYFGLPASVAIFPPISVKEGPSLEKEFHIHEKIYFSKGL